MQIGLKINNYNKYVILLFKNIDELKEIFKNKELHPEDLKKFVVDYLIELLRPAREHFEKEEGKKMLEELNKLIS